MKTFFNIIFLPFSILFIHAQNNSMDYPDMANPKIIKIQALLNDEFVDYEELNQAYDAILKGNSMADKIHLFVFDLSHPKGPMLDYTFQYHDEILEILQSMDELPKSDFKTFAAALVYNRAAQLTYEEPEEKKNLLNQSFHSLLRLAEKGDERSVIPLAWASSELYSLDFKDEHLSEELIFALYNSYITMDVDINKLIHYLVDGLHYENNYGIPLSKEAEKEKALYKEISLKIIKNYLTQFPEATFYLLAELYNHSLLRRGFDQYSVRYQPELGKVLNELVESMKNETASDYQSMKRFDFLFRFFLDEQAQLRIEDFVKMFDNKEMAYDYFIGFLNEMANNDYKALDFLTIKPKWAVYFKQEIQSNWDETFPLVVRFSEEAPLLYTKTEIAVATIQKTMKITDELVNLMVKKSVDSGVALYILYNYKVFMEELMGEEAYRNHSQLKWELAKILLDFELSFLVMNKNHSPFILGMSNHFDHWTASEIATYQDDIEAYIYQYIVYYDKFVKDPSIESELIKSQWADILEKFGLL